MKFTVFGRPGCMWCDRAMDLLSSKDTEFGYVNILEDPAARQFISNAGHTTVPQIYKEDGDTQTHIGGYVELNKMFMEMEKPAPAFEDLEEFEEEPEIPPTDPKAESRVIDKYPVPETCHYCEGSVRLANNKEIYNGISYGVWPLVYLCDGCGAYVGVHRNTHIPMGSLADEPTREARILAKDAFNPLWISHGMLRAEAYAWLADAMQIPKEECHIGMFNVEQCLEVVKHVQKYKESLE